MITALLLMTAPAVEAVQAAPAPAPEAVQAAQDTRPVLWGPIRIGMSKDEVEAALTANNNSPRSERSWDQGRRRHYFEVTFARDCSVTAYVYYTREQVVKEVRMSDSIDETCSAQILAGLTAKYGQGSETTNMATTNMASSWVTPNVNVSYTLTGTTQLGLIPRRFLTLIYAPANAAQADNF